MRHNVDGEAWRSLSHLTGKAGQYQTGKLPPHYPLPVLLNDKMANYLDDPGGMFLWYYFQENGKLP